MPQGIHLNKYDNYDAFMDVIERSYKQLVIQKYGGTRKPTAPELREASKTRADVEFVFLAGIQRIK